MSVPVHRPTLRGLTLPAKPITQELAELALQRAAVEIAAVMLRSVSLSTRAAENRAIALLAHEEPPVPPFPRLVDAVTHPLELVELGRLHHRAGELDQAERCYIQALKLDEGCESAHRSYGSLLEEKGELRDARSAYLWATRSKETVSAWLGLARIESELGHPAALELPIARALRSARSMLQLLEVGVTSSALDQPRLGIAAFSVAAGIETKEPAFPYAAARLAESIGEPEATREHACEAVRRAAAIGDHAWTDRATAIRGRSPRVDVRRPRGAC